EPATLGNTTTWSEPYAESFWFDDRLSRPESPVTDKSRAALLRFGRFELDLEAEQLLKNRSSRPPSTAAVQAALPVDEPDRQTRDPRGDPGSAVERRHVRRFRTGRELRHQTGS